jgi:hypothetical protein
MILYKNVKYLHKLIGFLPKPLDKAVKSPLEKEPVRLPAEEFRGIDK